MSWSCSTGTIERNPGDDNVKKAINDLTASQHGAPQDKVDAQLGQAKAAAFELIVTVNTPKLVITLGGHVHTGQDAPDATNVSVYGQS